MRESNEIKGIPLEFKTEDSFAAYSMPGSSDYNLVYQTDKKCSSNRPVDSPSFIIAPFALETNSALYIRAEHILTNVPFKYKSVQESHSKSTSESKYLNDLEHIIQDIHDAKYQKLVYSRVINVDHTDVSIYAVFARLVKLHKNAFVFCYHTPQSGCWIGATPELLIKKDVENYKTVALAGTQVDVGIPLEQVEWGQKEQDEQQFLRVFIKKQLQSIEIGFREQNTQTIKAGNVLHIATEFQIDQTGDMLTIAGLLHPGPAICGTPQETAYNYINQYESHQRDSYCGFIGPMNIAQDSALYVNLRSMRIYKNQVLLYVGGGITIDSEPREEWEETENKSLTLLDVIQKSYKH